MRHLIISTILLINLSSPAAAIDAQGRYSIFGAGIISCSSWTEDRQKDGVLSWQREQWVLGFISGYNRYVKGAKNIAAGMDADGMKGWIDTYCRDNSTASINKATWELIRYLNGK